MKLISWTALHKIQKVKFVQSMYIWLFIVPVFAKAFQKVNDAATVTVFDYTFELQFTLPFTWQLFYFSAIFFVLGNLCFYIYCPRFIKEHDNFSDFEASGKDLKHLYEYTRELDTKWEAVIDDSRIQEEPKQKDLQKAHQAVFWTIHRIANKYYNSARITTGIFYGIAISLIIFVLLENTHVVIDTIFNSI